MGKYALEIAQLNKTYRNGVRALNDINLNVEDGDSIYVREYPYRQAKISGAVLKPGSYTMSAGETISDLIKRNYQTLSYYGISKIDLMHFFKKNKPLGIDRVVPIGNTLDFSLNWDGYNL